MTVRRILQLAVVLLLPTTVFAEPHYTYLQGGYLDHNSPRDDDEGLSLAGSLRALPMLSLLGEHSSTGRFEHTAVGLLFHVPLLRGLDLNLGGTYDALQFGDSDDGGQSIRGGLRWRPLLPGIGDRFELNPEVRRTYVFNESQTAFRANALITLARALDFFSAVQTGDDDRFEFGVRFNFRPAQDFSAFERAQAEDEISDRLATYENAYRGALDAMRDAQRLQRLEEAAADKRAAELRAAARKAARDRLAARKLAESRRQPATPKPALECTPECCAQLREQSSLAPSVIKINGIGVE